jgi:hypothetical protein
LANFGSECFIAAETRRQFPFVPGSGEYNSVPGKILTD